MSAPSLEGPEAIREHNGVGRPPTRPAWMRCYCLDRRAFRRRYRPWQDGGGQPHRRCNCVYQLHALGQSVTRVLRGGKRAWEAWKLESRFFAHSDPDHLPSGCRCTD